MQVCNFVELFKEKYFSYTLKIRKKKSFSAKIYLIFIFFTVWFHFSIYKRNSVVEIPLKSTFYSYFWESFSGEYHKYQFILPHSYDNLYKILLNKTWRLTKAIAEMKWHWTKDEIEVAVQSWLWMRVEPMTWSLCWLECLNRIQWW